MRPFIINAETGDGILIGREVELLLPVTVPAVVVPVPSEGEGALVTVVVAVLVTCCVHAAELARRRIIILLGELGMNFDRLESV